MNTFLQTSGADAVARFVSDAYKFYIANKFAASREAFENLLAHKQAGGMGFSEAFSQAEQALEAHIVSMGVSREVARSRSYVISGDFLHLYSSRKQACNEAA